MPPSTDPSPDDELRFAVQRLVRRIRNNRGRDDIGDTAMSVLFRVDKTGDATPGTLAEHEHVTPPSMNRTLNGLERGGYITRTPDPDDARRVRIRLTAFGSALVVETRRLRTAWFSTRLAALDPAERALLDAAAPVLKKLAEE